MATIPSKTSDADLNGAFTWTPIKTLAIKQNALIDVVTAIEPNPGTGNFDTLGSVSGAGITVTDNLALGTKTIASGAINTGSAAVTTNSVIFGANGLVDSSSVYYAGLIALSPPQAQSGTGAVQITQYFTGITNAGASTHTMADGVVKGQLKKIYMVSAAGNAVITPAHLAGGNTAITMTTTGNYIVLMWNGTSWLAIEAVGATLA